jgi:hypothetical protein
VTRLNLVVMRRTLLGCLILLASLAFAQSADRRWEAFQFMIGKWSGEGAGQPGAGQGVFTFLPELNGQVLVRRNFNQLASGPRHDDLMIVYIEEKTPHAIYFDSEGHTIHYKVMFPAKNRAVFESDASQPGPKYRLSYALDDAKLNGQFEVDGKTYLSWSTVKSK